MSESTPETRIVPLAPERGVLTDLLRDGARRLLAQKIETEVAARIDDHAHLTDGQGRRQVVRDGHLPERAIRTGIDPAEGRKQAEEAFDWFVATYEAKDPKATGCLANDRAALLTSYDLPAEPWLPIRTTNPIKSVFSTVQLRRDKAKGSGSRTACLAMVDKLMESASKGWRSLNGSPLRAEVVEGTVFIDGVGEKPAA
jgi:hypothetical protein